MSNVLKTLLIALLVIGFPLSSIAMSPDEYCDVHGQSGAPGTCTTKDDCVVITTNIGTEECKKCTDGGCELTNCNDCGITHEE